MRLDNTKTKAVTSFALAILCAGLLCGCEALIEHFDGKAQYYKHHYAVQRVSDGSYLGEGGKWVAKKPAAHSYLYYEALREVEKFGANYAYTIVEKN